MGNVLILMAVDESANELSGKAMNRTGKVQRASIYHKYNNVLIRVIRKLWRDLNIPGYQIWFDNWWRDIESYDVVIAVAYRSTYRLFKIMKKKYPEIRRIMYWWDPVEKVICPDQVKESVCEKWTFCKRDALRYGLRLNTTFLPVSIKDLEYSEEYYEIMFVGSCGEEALYKNRADMISELSTYCDEKGIRTSFHISYKSKSKKQRPFEMKHLMSEKEYYELLIKSKAVLDIVEQGHEWMTLRPLEALYFQKKLISNNVMLIEEPLYHPDNIFLLGKDDLGDLGDFLDRPLHKFEDYVYKYYTFEAWLERFGIMEKGDLI